MGSSKNSLERPVGKEDLVKYVGIDLHKQDLVVAVEEDSGRVGKPVRIACEDEGSYDESQIFARLSGAVVRQGQGLARVPWKTLKNLSSHGVFFLTFGISDNTYI